MNFGPCFFKDEHPELISKWLAEERLPIFVYRNEVVYQYFLQLSVNPHHNLVYPTRVVTLSIQHVSDHWVIFCQCCQSWEEVAILECPLDDMMRFDSGPDKYGVRYYLGYSFPLAVLYSCDISKAVLLCRKLLVNKLLFGFFKFFRDLFVLRPLYFSDGWFLAGKLFGVNLFEGVAKLGPLFSLDLVPRSRMEFLTTFEQKHCRFNILFYPLLLFTFYAKTTKLRSYS